MLIKLYFNLIESAKILAAGHIPMVFWHNMANGNQGVQSSFIYS
ncbi:hypothetical protein A33Q_4094 [Indibacter alkaliphilus LW1]|uniref:Uncharacterized protein n=1 Tax=Indibacter alkaliphilus (strain CCUG 57479 / KCTC 22604 / LW1) TaxID=1189612 RepID=S2DJ71_INDAL|nr:hypothetical protein A33Q_4094 [Indibacter alkaliphilus LW1]